MNSNGSEECDSDAGDEAFDLRDVKSEATYASRWDAVAPAYDQFTANYDDFREISALARWLSKRSKSMVQVSLNDAGRWCFSEATIAFTCRRVFGEMKGETEWWDEKFERDNEFEWANSPENSSNQRVASDNPTGVGARTPYFYRDPSLDD